jgi:hypothetical protein
MRVDPSPERAGHLHVLEQDEGQPRADAASDGSAVLTSLLAASMVRRFRDAGDATRRA